MGSQFAISVLLNLCSESVEAWNLEILAEDSNTGGPSSFTVRMKYLFAFQFWYCKLCVEDRWGGGRGQKALFCWFLLFDIALLVGGRQVVGWGRKSYLRPAETSPFSSQDLIQGNKHDWLWLVVLTGYFYILFLWGFVVSDLPPLEIQKVFWKTILYAHDFTSFKKNNFFQIL